MSLESISFPITNSYSLLPTANITQKNTGALAQESSNPINQKPSSES